MIPKLLSLQDDKISLADIKLYLTSILEGKTPTLTSKPTGFDDNTRRRLDSFVTDGLAVSPGAMMILANGRVSEDMLWIISDITTCNVAIRCLDH